jgi:diacylglycerol kinase family enzyme/membrane-associated phospholipid phosphatase
VTHRALDAVRRADRSLFARAARLDAPVLDRVLPRLTSAADHGVLWFGLAGAVALTGTTGRRAATRGLASLAVASALANGPAKYLIRRQRPVLDAVPVLRLLTEQPGTTSFPSGHSASAAAFATGVSLESPALAPLVGALAAGVAYGRIHTGVHYPADVVAGLALGVGAAMLVRSSWPVRPDRAGVAAVAEDADAPALPGGEGLTVVVNLGAGSADESGLQEEISRALPAAEIVTCDDPEQLEKCLEASAEHARALGIAGGDGTIGCGASVALRHHLPLAVFPAGTLNHFAADLGVDDVEAVAAAVTAGEAARVCVASAVPDGDDLFFLNTFSVGLYPEMVHRREQRERWLGKWPALAVALAEVLHSAQPLTIDVDGETRRLWLLFGGNGRYHPAGFAPSWRERLDDPRIDVRMVSADRRFGRTRLIVAVLSGRLGRCRVYEERRVDRLELRIADDDVQLARDGEVGPLPPELCLRPAERPLVVYRPAPQ